MMYVLLIVGFALLVKGADFFVDGSSSVAKLLKVPAIIIGLTIVAFGTSAPELAVSVTAALSGNNQIAVGNIIGSNSFNLLMVIGLCSIIKPMPIDKKMLMYDYTFSIIVTIVLFIMLYLDKTLGRVNGIILLAMFSYYMFRTVKTAMLGRSADSVLEEMAVGEEIKVMSPIKSIIFILAGLAGIVWGGNLVVSSASDIAAAFGLSQTLIGLTIVAIGTSLPELVTSMVAAKKGEHGLALGNVIGSNIFNILLILGVSSTITPIAVEMVNVMDLIFLIVFTLVVWWLAGNDQKINRKEGAIMVAMYIAYMIYAIKR